MPTQFSIPRPPPSPADRGHSLYESEVIGFGYARISATDPEFRRERTAYGFPSIAMPRRPYQLQIGREPFFVADRNTAGFLSIGEAVRRRALTDQGMFNDWIDVHPQVLGDMLAGANATNPSPSYRFPWTCGPLPLLAVTQVHRLSAAINATTGFDALRIEETLLHAVHQIIITGLGARAVLRGRPPSLAQSQFHRDAVEEVRRQLACVPEAPHRLCSLAASVHLSPFHLCRVFKRHTGLPIHRYLEQIRLRRALESVFDTDDRMITIAKATGFCSESHLSNAFLRTFGLRPSFIRRNRSTFPEAKDKARRAQRTPGSFNSP